MSRKRHTTALSCTSHPVSPLQLLSISVRSCTAPQRCAGACPSMLHIGIQMCAFLRCKTNATRMFSCGRILRCACVYVYACQCLGGNGFGCPIYMQACMHACTRCLHPPSRMDLVSQSQSFMWDANSLSAQVKEPNLEMLARGKTVYEPARFMTINTVRLAQSVHLFQSAPLCCYLRPPPGACARPYAC